MDSWVASTERTPGLSRLLSLESERRWLFQGDRSPSADQLYPTVFPSSLDPHKIRGCFVPQVGLLPPLPLVSNVFPSAWVALALAVTQNLDRVHCYRMDDFPDDSVAVFLGENFATAGAAQELAAQARELPDRAPLNQCFVNVLSRAHFSADRLDYPMPGSYVSTEIVPVEERIEVTAGDFRALTAAIGRPRIRFGNSAEVRRDPFTGSLMDGGHLQFDPVSGARLPIRIPTESDRRASLARVSRRGHRWLQRINAQPLGGGESPSVPRTQRTSFGQALKFIQENCARSLTVAEIAEVAHLSSRHLHAVFREVLGCTPLGYAADRRLDLAEKLIVETSLTVSEIAERCGFAEPTSLTRSLRRRRGVTPLALRRSARSRDAG